MSWLYGQTWLWYLIAFAVGVLLAWLFLVRPQERRLRQLSTGAAVGTAGPERPAPESAIPNSPTPESPAPKPPAPESLAPGSLAADSLAADSPTPALPAPAFVAADPALSTLDTGGLPIQRPAAAPVAPGGASAPEAVAAGPYPGSALAGPAGAAPGAGFTIKGNSDSMLFHTPESPYYGRTTAEVWFGSAEEAEAAGFTSWTRR